MDTENNLLVFKSVEQVYNYLNEIPEDKWCKHTVENKDGQCCALGHLGKAVEGQPEYDWDLKYMLEDIGVNIWNLAEANNNSKSAKQGSLDYLKKLFKK